MKLKVGAKGAIQGLSEWPNCGCTPYYRKTRVTGMTKTSYNFDGSPADNELLHDSLKYVDQKTIYCEDCNAVLGTAE